MLILEKNQAQNVVSVLTAFPSQNPAYLDKELSNVILELLQKENLNSRELEKKTQKSADAIIFALQSLLEQDKIKILPNNKYTLQ